MQYNTKQFDSSKHDIFKALVLEQPHANNLIDISSNVAVCQVAFIDKKSKHRGKTLVCSTHKPLIYGLECGATLGFVDVYDMKRASQMSESEWTMANIDQDKRAPLMNKYALFLKNPRRVIEMPFSGTPGFYHAVYDKDEIMEYPTAKINVDNIKKLLNEKILY